MPFTPSSNQEQYKPIIDSSIEKDSQEKENLLMKIGDFLGIKKFGQGIAGAGQYIAGETSNVISNATGGKINLDPTYKAITDKMNAGTATPEEISSFKDMTGANLSAKEVLGSAANTVLNIATAGVGAPETFLGKVGAGAATGYGFDVASKMQENKPMDEALKPGMATVVGATLPIAGKALSASGNVIKHISSYLSGVPAEAIETAFNKPDEIGAAIKNLVKNDEEKVGIVNRARKGLENIMEKRNTEYSDALKNISESQDTTNLSLGGLKQKVKDTLGQFKLLNENGKIDFTKSPFPKSQNNQLTEALQRINTWKDTSPTGLNDLTKVIGGYFKGTAESKPFDKIIITLKDNLRNYVSENVPAIAEMNKNYAKHSEVIDQMVKELSLGEGKSPTTALNKLTSIFNRNSEFKKKLVQRLGEQGGHQLMDDIIGSMFTEWFPRGLSSRVLSGFGGLVIGSTANVPGAAAGAVMASPRLLGKATINLGRLSQAIHKLPVDEAGKISKTALMDLLSK